MAPWPSSQEPYNIPRIFNNCLIFAIVPILYIYSDQDPPLQILSELLNISWSPTISSKAKDFLFNIK